MKFSKPNVIVASILLVGINGIASADNEPGFTPFSDAKLYAQFRPRLEHADVDDGVNDAATALTARTVIGGEFSQVGGISSLIGHLEATNVSHFGIMDDYAPEQKTGYDVIMDPSQTRMTQAHLTYSLGDTTLIAGRKMHAFDNQRFIGHAGWRQMFQTYDMIAVANKSIPNLALTGAYVNKVNRITESGKLDTQSILLHSAYAFDPVLNLSAYGYMLASIHDSFGVRATGKQDFSGVKLSYEAEYAFQDKPSLEEESMGDIKPDHEADYYKLGFRINYTSLIFGLDYEVLGKKEGSGGSAFNTPLASLHGMNGWADKFLATPVDGLVDTAITVGYLSNQFGRIIAIYRNFESDNGGKDYGSEFDMIYARNLFSNLGLTLKVAFYEAGADLKNGDTTKYWAMLDYRFNF